MQKRAFVKKIVVATTLAMTIGCMSGCGSKDNNNQQTSTENKPTETNENTTKETTDNKDAVATEAPAVAGIDGWSAFDEKVTLRIPVYDRGAEGIDPVDSNDLTEWVQKNFGDKYNITLEYEPITRSDVMTSYALLAASSELPTILMEYDYPKVTQWANDGYMNPISLDDFKQVAPNYYNRMVELNQLQYTEVNQDTYFVLAERPYFNTPYTFCTFVRLDWLKQVGYDHVPKSYQEYTEAMDKIMAAGIAEHPAGGSMVTSAYVANYGFRDYPVNAEEWAMYSSLGTASLSWKPTYELIKRANAEYSAGYTNPEYYITDLEVAKANFVNGKTYSYGGYMSASVDWLTSFYAANPTAELAIASNYGAVDGTVMEFPQVRSDNPYGMTIGFSSAATEDELKAAWMYLEWCTQPDILNQLQHNEWNNFNNSKDYWCVTIESIKMDTIEESIAAISPQGLPQDFTQDIINNYYELKEIADAGHAYTDPAIGVTIDAESEYNATLLSLYIEYYDKLVMCNPSEFDTLYQELSQEYLDAGYKAIIDQRLAAYKAGNTTKLPDQK